MGPITSLRNNIRMSLGVPGASRFRLPFKRGDAAERRPLLQRQAFPRVGGMEIASRQTRLRQTGGAYALILQAVAKPIKLVSSAETAGTSAAAVGGLARTLSALCNVNLVATSGWS